MVSVKFMMGRICYNTAPQTLGPFQSTFAFQSIFNNCQSHVINNVIVSSSSLWHRRLGHPFDAKLSCVKNVISDTVYTFNKDCEIFSLAKHKRLPFPFHNHLFYSSFDMIHCDI